MSIVEVVPSPKLHKTEVGAGVVVLIKLTGASSQTLGGVINDACTKSMTTALDLTIVFVQPVLLTTFNVTVKLPIAL